MIKILLSLILISTKLSANNFKSFPIQYSIPSIKIVKEIPKKTQDFANATPGVGPGGNVNNYIYNKEEDYYADYQRSYFGLTKCKGGWDCPRHYEILANGCIPYFIDLDKCPKNTMLFLPKDLIKEAMNLDGVSYMKIDHSKFNKDKYFELLNKILEHTKKYLTCDKMAEYVLKTVNYSGKGKILLLSLEHLYEPHERAEYLRDLVTIGLKQILGEKLVDEPKITFLYKNYEKDVSQLYGRGFTYTKILDDIPTDRTNIKERIKNHEFEFIIFTSVHDAYGQAFDLNFARQYYKPEEIIFLCGVEGGIWGYNCWFTGQVNNLFIREYFL